MSAAILFADRVKDTTTTTGTGNITLAGSPPTGFQSFNSAFGTSTYFYYTIEGGAEWEVGKGHLSASTTLVRDTVYASSNSNAAVSFAAGTKNVFCTVPASYAQNTTPSGVLASPRTSTAQDDEFEGTFLDAKWTKTNSATVESYDDKIRSAAYFEHAASSSDVTLRQTYANAGNFSITAAVSQLNSTNFHNCALYISNGGAVNVGVQLLYNSGVAVRSMKDSAQQTSVTLVPTSYPVYHLHIQRVTNNWNIYYSHDCITWSQIGATVANTFTVADFSLTFGVGGAAVKTRTALHWIRRDWLTL
jgi:hypothetical protein